MKNGLVDSHQLLLLQQEEHYWKAVTIRVIECVRYLAERGHAFRGDSHGIGNPHNGNYLGAMEFLAKFDTFLADHIARYGSRGRGSPSYLSHFIMEEVIGLIKSDGAIKYGLEELASDEEQTITTRHEAGSISEKIDSLEFAFMVLFWYNYMTESIKPIFPCRKLI